MGRSRSKSKKKEKKSKHRKDKSRSRSRDRDSKKPSRISKFSTGPPTHGSPQHQQQSQSGLRLDAGSALQMGQGSSALGGNLAGILSIGGGSGGAGGVSGGPPILEISKPIEAIMTEQEFMKKNSIPENPDEQTLEQKVQLNQFKMNQLAYRERTLGQLQLDNALEINIKHNVHQNILQMAGINIKKNDNSSSAGANASSGAPALQLNPMAMQFAGSNPSLMATLADSSKIKRKVYVPQNGFNYTGLIIGPQGSNQKKMEEQSGCKILVRGKGSQKEGQPPQPDDDEDQHVLIVGDNEASVAKAQSEVERILFADEDTRNKIRLEQLKLVAQIKNQAPVSDPQNPITVGSIDPSLTTPYGPPSDDAYIIPVPRDCVGLVIGKGGDTIRQLQERSGASRVQVAMENQEGSDMRNVFVEGSAESVEIVKKMLSDIVENQRRMKQGLNQKSNREEYGIPHNMVGLVIGKGGETVKTINSKTGAFVVLSKEEHHQNLDKKIVFISGTSDQIEAAKQEIETIIDNGIKYQQQKQQQFQQQQQQQMQGRNFPPMNMPPMSHGHNGNNLRSGMPPPSSSGQHHFHEQQKQRYNQDPYHNNNNDNDLGYNQNSSRMNNDYKEQQQQQWNEDMNGGLRKPETNQSHQSQQQMENQQQQNSYSYQQPPSQQQQYMPMQMQPWMAQPQLTPQQQMLLSAVEGPQIEEIGGDEGDYEVKKRRRRKKNE